MKIKYADIAYNKDMSNPVLFIYIENEWRLGTDEYSIFYNPKTETWYGDANICGEWEELRELDLDTFKALILNYDSPILAYGRIRKYLEYCKDNNLNNLGLSYIMM